MPQRTITYAKGNYYHIYNRGEERRLIFREERNYLYLLQLLTSVSAECSVSVIAYCLLPNHYHWLLRQDGDTAAGDVPRRVFGSYSQAFNRAYGRRGTLFESRYKAIPVHDDAYLWTLCRYIHRNPVKHGLVSAPEDWPHSNYHEWIERRPGRLVDRQLIKSFFPTPADYLRFVSQSADAEEQVRDRLDRST